MLPVVRVRVRIRVRVRVRRLRRRGGRSWAAVDAVFVRDGRARKEQLVERAEGDVSEGALCREASDAIRHMRGAHVRVVRQQRRREPGHGRRGHRGAW